MTFEHQTPPMSSSTLEIPKKMKALLAPNEEIVWTGRAHPPYPIPTLLVDAIYVCWAAVAWILGMKLVFVLTIFGLFALLFVNMLAFTTYGRSAGSVYICTNRRYLVIRPKAGGKMKFIALPRRGVGYVGVQKRSLVLYNDIVHNRRGDFEVPEGFLELDDVQEAMRVIETSVARVSEPCPEPKPLNVGDLPLPVALREYIGRMLAEGEKLLYAATPGRRFGFAQVLGLFGVAAICWGAFFIIRESLMQENIRWVGFVIGLLLGTVIFCMLLLTALAPLIDWWHRRTSFFILTDRRACELGASTGKILQTWDASPDLIKKATLYRNGTGNFLFSLCKDDTSRWDATDCESGVDALPDALHLIALINSLPQR